MRGARELPDDPIPLAEAVAERYLEARSPEVIRTLLREGGKWDGLTRSMFMYHIFEKRMGEHFPILWTDESTEEELREFMGL